MSILSFPSDIPAAVSPRPLVPPRPVVPRPEAIVLAPLHVVAAVWPAAPRIARAERRAHAPCTVVYGNTLWVGYLAEPGDHIAVVQFSGYIEHQESRIGAMLASHPYHDAGLVARAFNELSDSLLAQYWRRFEPRHWVVNFPDRTLDVVARSAHVVALPAEAPTTFDGVHAAIAIAVQERAIARAV